MVSLINSCRIVQKLNFANSWIFTKTARSMAGWNKDYKPGPFPKTDEECLAAAKKYYLLPEEYNPYPDNGLGYGDYPKLEGGLGDEARNPFYPYDFPALKRNFKEFVNSDVDLYGEDRWSLAERPRFTTNAQWLSFIGCMIFCLALYYWLENYKMYRPVAVKQYPGDGRKHYTFELE